VLLALSPRMLRVIEELAGDWRRLDQRIDGLSGEIEALARQDQALEAGAVGAVDYRLAIAVLPLCGRIGGYHPFPGLSYN
jgi:hypothetical protein